MEKAPVETTVSIVDLPLEVLEQIVVHLDAKTISALRAVNRYFNHVFNSDIFWKQFLYYPEKEFLCDLRSQSTAPGVKEVKEELAQGRLTKWRGYFQLQKTHINNWESGLSDNFDIITLPPTAPVLDIHDMVDDHYEHWLFFSVGEVVHIWNVTTEPRELDPVWVGPHADFRLLPEGKFLIEDLPFNDRNFRIISVYRFENPMYILQFQYKFIFSMENILEENVEPSWEPSRLYSYCVMKNLLCGCDYHSTEFDQSFLHVWNLDSGSKSCPKVSLVNYGIMQAFVHFVKLKMEGYSDCASHEWLMTLYPGEYPQLVFVVKHVTTFVTSHDPQGTPEAFVLSQVNIFNVETMQFTHLVAQLSSCVTSASLYYDKVCVEERICPYSESGNSRASVYVIDVEPVTAEQGLHGEQLMYLDTHTDLWCQNRDPRLWCEHRDFILFQDSKVLVMVINEMHVINLSSKPLQHWQFKVDPGQGILGFIEPKMLLLHAIDNNGTSGKVKAYNILSGVELCSWEVVDYAFPYYFENLKYPSKLILNVSKENEFRVFNF